MHAGRYPKEVAGLVAETRGAVGNLTTAYKGYTTAGCDDETASSSIGDCTERSKEVASSADALVRQLDQWRPYIE